MSNPTMLITVPTSRVAMASLVEACALIMGDAPDSLKQQALRQVAEAHLNRMHRATDGAMRALLFAGAAHAYAVAETTAIP